MIRGFVGGDSARVIVFVVVLPLLCSSSSLHKRFLLQQRMVQVDQVHRSPQVLRVEQNNCDIYPRPRKLLRL
jgi:hypothetical protein